MTRWDFVRYCSVLLPVVWLVQPIAGQTTSDSKFTSEVEPILKQKCLGCHNEKSRSSGFSVASREDVLRGGARHGNAIQPGRADQSTLIKFLRGELSPQMPLGGAPLPESAISSISNWIAGLSADPQTVSKTTWRVFDPPVASAP